MQIETLTQASQGPATRLIICVVLAHHLFQPVGQQGADGRPLLGSHDLHFPQKSGIKFERDVCLHLAARIYVQHDYTCSGGVTQVNVHGYRYLGS